MTQNTIAESILKAVGDDPNGCTTEKICRLLRNTPQELGSAFELLKGNGQILGFAGLWLSPAAFGVGVTRFMEALNQLHAASPTQPSIPLDTVVKAAKLTWSEKPLDRILAALVSERKIEMAPPGIRSLAMPLQLTGRQADLLSRAIEVLEKEPVNTPTPHGIAQQLGLPWQAIEEILKLGVQAGTVVRLDEGVFYTPAQIEHLKGVTNELTEGKPFSMTELRDKLQTTRKYVMPLLEYFDSVGFTVGNANERVILSADGDRPIP